jgi:hypothetical protein
VLGVNPKPLRGRSFAARIDSCARRWRFAAKSFADESGQRPVSSAKLLVSN